MFGKRLQQYTGCPDQIGHNFKIALLNNQKTCRKCKDSFGIVRNSAIKYVLELDRGNLVGLLVFYGIHIIRL